MNESPVTRREFMGRLAQMGLVGSAWPALAASGSPGDAPAPPESVLTFPGPWSFQLPKGGIILVSDRQLEDLQDPDREVDLSLSATPNRTTLRRICQQAQASGARTLILAFDHFWAQYRPGQGDRPRQLMPDTEAYIQKIKRLSETLKEYHLGLELSLLSPLELGPGYLAKTGEQGRWVQYREGLRDPQTGQFDVSLWEHRRWTNNKGSIDVQRAGVRAFAFRERRLDSTPFYVVRPEEIVELTEPPIVQEWPGVNAGDGKSFSARRITVRGHGDTGIGPLDRVLVVVSYHTPEMDYFSPKALPFLKDLVRRYHAAGIPLNGLYSDEMHIQQDWVYSGHHDEGQFTWRFLTPHLARTYAEQYGAEFQDLEKYLVYFCYGQHHFLSTLEPRLAAQHVLGGTAEEIQRTFLLRRRYYDLLDRTVIGLFAEAKQFAEQLYGHELEARAHATWAQSPTIDFWDTGSAPHAPKQYEYTSNFLWSNTIQQAACACDDYFRWNDFLTGGGNDHAEGGWSDRDYYALALACSTGILNRTPYAYAAHWGMPAAVSERRQALVDAYGASASPAFQAIEHSEHRDVEVLMLYPLALVACEERFGSWMTQYGYTNYVTADRLLARARVNAAGQIEMAGRKFGTLVALFEPLPPAGLLPFLDQFVQQGGRLLWSGPPPRLDMAGNRVAAAWQRLFGIRSFGFREQGWLAPGERVEFEGLLRHVPTQTILTSFLVDQVYPVEPEAGVATVARWSGRVVGTHRKLAAGGSATHLGFRPRDDQAASLGYETRTWFDILNALGAYPASKAGLTPNDNPSVLSREGPYLVCRFPNGTTTIATHYRRHAESWPGGFHRNAEQDAASLARNPLPSDRLQLKDYAAKGCRVTYDGRLLVAFRLGPDQSLAAFGGYDCEAITLSGREYRFAQQRLAHLAWAPVAEDRRVPGGALFELWVAGEGEVQVPVPPGLPKARLFFQGPRLGSLGQEVPVSIRQPNLTSTPAPPLAPALNLNPNPTPTPHAVFTSRREWGSRHLYLL